MMKSNAQVTLLGLTALLFGSAAASAQSFPPEMQALMQACRGDVKSLCPGVMPGGGRIARCLEANTDKVSASCQTAMDTSIKAVCGADITRLCGNIAPGKAAISACLRDHTADLSGTCKSLSAKFAIK